MKRPMSISRAACLLTAALAAACQAKPESSQPAQTGAASTKPAYGAFGVDLTARKESVKPGDDFFAYANGTWLDTFTIPPDKAAYGMGNKVDDDARANVRKIIEDAAAQKKPAGSIEQKIGDYYASFMDTAKIEADGI